MKSDTTEHGFTTSVYESPSRRSLRSGSQSVSAETAIFYPHTACLRHQVDNCAKCMAEERKSLRESQTRAKAQSISTPWYRTIEYPEPNLVNYSRPLRFIKSEGRDCVVEYDCKKRDEIFVHIINSQLASLLREEILLDTRQLERLIDAIETHLYDNHELLNMIGKIRDKWNSVVPASCGVCFRPQSAEALKRCARCQLVVHSSCYKGGISSAVNIDDSHWMCDWCFQREFAGQDPSLPTCILCDKRGGITKRTQNSDWCHIICFENHSATTFDEFDRHVVGVDSILPNISQKCTICQETGGAPIKCSIESCEKSIHSSCAHQMVQQLYGIILASHLGAEVPHKLQCEEHTLSRWADAFMATRTQGLNTTLVEDSLVERMQKDIDSIIVSKGSTRPVQPVILSLVFHYWLFYANPHFPEQFLVPSLYIADDMKRQEAKWTTRKKKRNVRSKRPPSSKRKLPRPKKQKTQPKATFKCLVDKSSPGRFQWHTHAAHVVIQDKLLLVNQPTPDSPNWIAHASFQAKRTKQNATEQSDTEEGCRVILSKGVS